LARARGISESLRYVYNPLPNVGEASLLEEAGLSDLMTPSKRSPFLFAWKYGTGLESETVEIAPGEFLPLRESEAREFERCTNALELGLCVVSKADANDPATRKAALEALQRATRFYYDAGKRQLLEQRKRHNYTEQDMHEQRSRYHPYYLNAAKEKAIAAHMQQLKAPKGKAA
jgi:hypothetical protein